LYEYLVSFWEASMLRARTWRRYRLRRYTGLGPRMDLIDNFSLVTWL